MRKLLFLSVLTLFTLVGIFAQTETNIDFEKYSLDNGLTVILSQDNSSPIVSVRVWYKVGSKDEFPGKSGMVSIAGQMMFKGSENVSPDEHKKLIKEVGGTARSSVDYDRSEFMQDVPGNALQLALWLESDRMNSISRSLKEKDFNNFKARLVEDKSRLQSEKGRDLWRDELFALSYLEDYPYHWSSTGNLSEIEKLELSDVVKFMENYYIPNNAILIITGDFNPDQAKFWIDSYFGHIKAGADLAKREYDFPGFSGVKSKIIIIEEPISSVYLNYPFLKMGFKETYAMDMVAQILGNGESSRLYQRLVKERQVAQRIIVTPWSLELNSHFIIIVIGAQGVTAKELEYQIRAVMDQCKENPFTDAETEKAKNKLKIWLTEWVDTNAGKGFLFGAYEAIFQNPALITKELSKYDDITADELNEALKKYLVPENSNTLIYSSGE